MLAEIGEMTSLSAPFPEFASFCMSLAPILAEPIGAAGSGGGGTSFERRLNVNREETNILESNVDA